MLAEKFAACHVRFRCGPAAAYLKAIQERALALKRDGKTADEAARIVQTELQASHPDWTGPAQAGSAARTAFNETR